MGSGKALGRVSLQHIHIIAEEKYALAKWYEETLGFEIIGDIEKLGEKEGPLVVSGDGGKTGLSIFDRQERHSGVGTTVTPAFEVEAQDFVNLYKKVSEKEECIVYDHLIFYSFYLKDPTQSTIEITNLEYAQLGALLKEASIPTLAANPTAE